MVDPHISIPHDYPHQHEHKGGQMGNGEGDRKSLTWRDVSMALLTVMMTAFAFFGKGALDDVRETHDAVLKMQKDIEGIKGDITTIEDRVSLNTKGWWRHETQLSIITSRLNLDDKKRQAQ